MRRLNALLPYRSLRCRLEMLESRQLLSADLASSFTTAVPTLIWPTGTTPITVHVTNVGSSAVRGQATVSLYASTDQTLDGGDTLLGSKAMSIGLAAGKGTNASLKVAHPDGLADGQYYILAQVLGDAAVADSNSANDVSATSTKVQIRDPFADLGPIVTKIPAKPVVISAGKTTTLSATIQIKNTGNTAAKGTITGNVYLSADPFPGAGDLLLSAIASRPVSIAPGKTASITISKKLTAGTASGIFRIVPQITFVGTPADDSTANNIAASTGTVTVTNAAVAAAPQLFGDLHSDVTHVVVGHPELVHFNLDTRWATGNSGAEVDEITSTGTVIGRVTSLFDDGSAANGDMTAGDGIYSGISAVAFSSPGTRYFMATFNDWSLSSSQRTATFTITGSNSASQQQLQLSVDDTTRLTGLAMDVLSNHGSAKAALDAIRNALLTDPDVVPGSVSSLGSVIQWEDVNGFLQGFDADFAIGGDRLSAPVPAAYAPALPTASTDAVALSAPADPIGDVLVLSPFASSLSARDPSAGIVTQFQNANYSVTYHTNTGVTLADFANLSDYAAIELYGHGTMLPDNTGEGFYTSIAPTAASMADNEGDLKNHRVRMLNGYYVVTPSYISAYGGSLDGTIVLANACESAHDATMANAFIGLGAAAYIGYTHTVKASFAAGKAVDTWTTLLKADHNTVGDIVGLDTAHDSNTPAAVFFHYGDKDAKLPQQDLLRNTDFYVRYSWPQTVRDLDTNTTFLGSSSGWDLDNSSPYMSWTGDDTSAGGAETTTVHLYSAWQDGAWSTTTTITVGTDWYTPAGGSGPAVITVALQNKITHKLTHVEVHVVSPGQESSGTHTVVGTITITLAGDPLDPVVKSMELT